MNGIIKIRHYYTRLHIRSQAKGIWKIPLLLF
nr:MAG TPA: hypothetical protein [Caudoviricetes sp.]